MQIDYHKEHSSRLGRDMEFKVYGHGGRPVLAENPPLFFPAKTAASSTGKASGCWKP